MLEQNPNDGLGVSGESYLVGSDKLMRSISRFQQNSIMKTRVSTQGVEKAFGDTTGTSVKNDYRGVKVLSSFSKLNVPGLDWVILAEIDYAEATKSIYFIRNNILILTILVAFVVFIISSVFSKRIILPLIKLNDAASNIKSGNLNVRLSSTAHNEIGQLTDSFNSMAESLREKDAELNNERNKRITAMINGQELERQRLSRELHDGLGQSLIALKLKLETIQGKDICALNKTVKEVKSSFDGTINEIRRISNDLMPAVLIEFGLITALKNICDDINENLKIELLCNYDGKFTDLNDKTSIYIYRIMQEALNNIIKHSKATHAEVNISRKQDFIKIMIMDNGKGLDFEHSSINTGNGIPNIKERVRLLDGEINFISQPGKGTQIRIDIPINSIHHGQNKSDIG
jgi:signal transduction histidine kinase